MHRTTAGFTVLELLFVMTLCLTLSTFAIININDFRQNIIQERNFEQLQKTIKLANMIAAQRNSKIELNNQQLHFGFQKPPKIKSKDGKLYFYKAFSCSPASIQLFMPEFRCAITLSLRCRIRTTC